MASESVDAPQVHLGFQSGDVVDAEKGTPKKNPRRIIYFQDGDELEEYSTEEEEEVDQLDVTVQRMASMDWKSLPWGSYLFNVGLFGFLKAFKSLEYAEGTAKENCPTELNAPHTITKSPPKFLREVLSYKLGITAPKYQSEIEEAARMEADEVEERKRAFTDDASWRCAPTGPNDRGVASTPPAFGFPRSH